MILQNNGIQAIPTYTNDPIIRLEVVRSVMQRLDFNGKPAFLMSSKCTTLRKAMAGGYKYRRMQVSGMERFIETPDKNKYSHVSDALQYLLLGAGEGDRVVGSLEVYMRVKQV